MKIIQHAVKYDTDYFVDENTLYRNEMVSPFQLTRAITYLWGKQSNATPLLNFTLGQVGAKPMKTSNEGKDTRYKWNVMGRMSLTVEVHDLVTNVAKPGLGVTPITIRFKQGNIHAFYSLYSPDGECILRAEHEPIREGQYFKVTAKLLTGDVNKYVEKGNFTSGKVWGYGVPTISSTKSDGTASNRATPGKATNQFGFFRFSNNIAGNIANKVTELEFNFSDGSSSKLWMPEEMRQFEWQNAQMLEYDLWRSEYNRADDGRLLNFDTETGEPIQRGSGVIETIKSIGHFDTYYRLTLAKVNSILNMLYDHRTDSTPTEIIIHTGRGGLRMWHEAIMKDAKANQFFEAIGDKFIQENGGYLSYGATFGQYRTIDKRMITVQETEYFDFGIEAQMQKANGDVYNGLPWHSYDFAILDYSTTDDGGHNIEMVVEKGREKLVKIYEGMSNIPDVWRPASQGGTINVVGSAATKKDVASYEIIQSGGINMRNPYLCYYLKFLPE